MKKTIFLGLLIIGGIFGVASVSLAESSGLTWLNNFEEGDRQASHDHKYVLVDVYTSWCGWCKRLEKDVFNDPAFVNYVKSRFVCVKANAEDGGSGQNLAAQNSVTGFPTALIFNDHGQKVGTIDGYKNTQDYIKALGEIIKK